jgi:hypothetical protein
MKMDEPGYRLDLDNIGFDLSQDIEVARILVSAQEETTVVVNPKAVDEPFALGVICADFMKHGAHAIARDTGTDPAEVFQAILRGLMAELQDPSGEVQN